MNWLSTAFCGLFALLSTAMALYAVRATQMCFAAALKLNGMRGRVVALEGALETLDAQHRKLSGKFHATHRRADPPTRDHTGYAVPGPVCENWARACDEGPNSTAASCECDYCSRQRFERRQLRMELIPKTAAGQGALAKQNSGQG